MAKITCNFFSVALKRTVIVNVLLPIDKAFSYAIKKGKPKPYKTLYLLHGLLGDSNDWIDNTNLRKLAEDHDLAVVMPSGENSFYVDSPVLKSSRFGTFIGKELVNVTRMMFPLSTKREDTFIGGLSMGGYGAIVNGMLNHRTFGAIAAFSSALHLFEIEGDDEEAHQIFGDMEKARKSILNPRKTFLYMEKQLHGDASKYPKIYLSCGRQDGLYPYTESYRDFLYSHGVDLFYHEEDGKHDWDFWNSEIKRVIEEFLPLGPSKEGISSGNVVL